METAILKIVKDKPPPKIVAQATLEAFLADQPTNRVVAGVVPRRSGQHLDVDGILARSLPKVDESFEKAA